MSQFDDFINAIVKGVPRLATGDLAGLVADAESDTEAFLERAEDKLRRRTQMLADGTIDEEDFEDLAKGQMDLIEGFALTQAGVAAARLEQFRKDLIDLVVSTAVKIFL
jgi:hypothetical protein